MADTTPTPAAEVKPGFKTTEFWLTIATNVAAVVSTVAGALPPEKAGILMAIANGIYAATRAFAKK